MQIITYPNPVLRKKLPKFTSFNQPGLKKFINQMSNFMIKEDGVGLAANQINSEIRVMIANTKNGPTAFFNPRIIKKSLLKPKSEEGCLSFPKIYGTVRRHKKITLEYEDIEGHTQQIQACGLMSVVLQHETDHLNGVLFVDKIKKFTDGRDRLEELRKTAKENEIR